ncbi:amino acid adenylation domain-containing protein [Streptomyces sp. NPDC050619]|uniref:non-ribosomal peptide synthetase n=1 Tax=Streptomyces sp. NPDC050619 TaxID=3157214 RepID=UPI0034351C97
MTANHTAQPYESPLTALQHGMLLHSLSAPDDGVYVQQKIVTLRHAVDAAVLRQALDQLVARHPVLRTTFVLDDPSAPRQVVHPHGRARLSVDDWRGEADSDGRVRRFLREDARRPFAFAEESPTRFALLRTGRVEYRLLWTSHHALMDGRSYALLLTELFELYDAALEGRQAVLTPRPGFDAYVRRIAEQDPAQGEAFWREYLDGVRSRTPLVVTAARTLGPGEDAFGTVQTELDADTVKAAAALAERCGGTLNNLVQAAWALLLGSYSGRSEVVFGVTKSRRSFAPEGRDMVGLLINTLPLRVVLDASATGADLVRALREGYLALRRGEHIELPRIHQLSAVPDSSALFDSVVVFESRTVQDELRQQGGAWQNRDFHLEERSNYPLTLSAYQGERLLLKLGHDRRQLPDTVARQVLHDTVTLLRALIDAPALPTGDLFTETGPVSGALARRRAACRPDSERHWTERSARLNRPQVDHTGPAHVVRLDTRHTADPELLLAAVLAFASRGTEEEDTGVALRWRHLAACPPHPAVATHVPFPLPRIADGRPFARIHDEVRSLLRSDETMGVPARDPQTARWPIRIELHTGPDWGGTTSPDLGGTASADSGGAATPDLDGTASADSGATPTPDVGGASSPVLDGTPTPDQGATASANSGATPTPDQDATTSANSGTTPTPDQDATTSANSGTTPTPDVGGARSLVLDGTTSPASDATPTPDQGATGFPGPVTSLAPTRLVRIAEDGTWVRWEDPDPATAARFAAFLDAVAADPHRPVTEVAALTSDERERVLVEWNDTAADYPSQLCVHELFTRQARRRPDAVAVACGDRTLTYRELDERSDRLAAELAARGALPGALVGVALRRSPELLVGLLAVLKSGAAYVPLDPVYPPERIAAMADDAQLRLVVTESALRPTLSGVHADLLLLDEDRERPAGRRAPVGADDRAYVIYTSGSTGRPKGVQIGHRALTNFLCAMARQFEVAEHDRLLAVTTVCFDIAGLELYLPLITGARVEIAPAETAADGFALRTLLERTRPTMMQATPATWRMLLTAGWAGHPGLKALCGGEALPSDLAEELLARAGALWNLYGPTETTIWSTVCRVERGDRVTIGRPLANTSCYVLDRFGEPVPPGTPGELYIGGDGVAHGYLGRPELTAERFVEDPWRTAAPGGARMYRTGDLVRHLPDGRLEYLNRVDSQVKLHGYRIELGEIEHHLRARQGIREAVSVVREDSPGDRRLVAYVVADPGTEPDTAVLRDALRSVLPGYMVPAVVVALNEVPLTPNGKVDRKALPAPDQPGPDRPAALTTDTERAVATVWRRVLGVPLIGPRDNFFDLGGNSLLLMHVVKELRDTLDPSVTRVDVFRYPTVGDMARHLAALRRGERPAAAARPARHRRESLERLRGRRTPRGTGPTAT